MLNDIIQEMNDAGMRIFPLLGSHDLEGDPLDEKEAFKRPRYSGWQNVPAGWSDEQLEVMQETGQFETGYGIVCRDILVIDVDPRNGGTASLEALLEKVPEIAGAGMIVETGRKDGGKHYYFRAPVGVSTVQHLKGYDGLDFKASGYVVGPGSMHGSGNAYSILTGSVDDIDDAPDALVDMLKRPEYHRTTHNGATLDVSHSDLVDMLSYIDPDTDHETWLKCGMACHDASQGSAFTAWDHWSSKGTKYPDRETLEKRWHSFGKSPMPATIGTLIHFAEQGGWRRSVTFDPKPIDTPEVTDPLDTSGIDLLRPPGFVGEVKDWIDDQCRYPREHLSTAAALISVGNVIGLRYTDDTDRATANLLAFGVAGSSSGKEAVMQAMQGILVETGISGASHGAMKSQQEIMRNLIRHQAAYYVIDEFGIELRKVVNAQKKGSAAYLEGLIGTIMSIYSKADGKALLSGDVKEEVRKALISEISQISKRLDNNEGSANDEDRLARTQNQLNTLDEGLDRPFLSLMGFTTPSTFDDIIDEDQATSGFLGRALLVREYETNPRPKWPFKKRPMSDAMRSKLQNLFSGGTFSLIGGDRVENSGSMKEVPTTDEAVEALREALNWTLDYAEDQKERSGLEAVVRRGYEMIAKVSLILAAPEGLRTIEHVRWAYALVKRDVDEKIRLVVSNDDTHGADKALMAKITKIISKDHGETFGVIKNRLRKYKPEDVQKALDAMVSGSVAKKQRTEHPKTKKEVIRYFYTG